MVLSVVKFKMLKIKFGFLGFDIAYIHVNSNIVNGITAYIGYIQCEVFNEISL